MSKTPSPASGLPPGRSLQPARHADDGEAPRQQAPPRGEETSWRSLRRNDRGAAALLWVAGIALVFTIAVAAVAIAEFAYARSQADTAADLAALSAARAVLTPTSCAAAGDVARHNGAQMRSCEVSGMDVVVTVERPVGYLLQQLAARAGTSAPTLRSTSRAGPPNS